MSHTRTRTKSAPNQHEFVLLLDLAVEYGVSYDSLLMAEKRGGLQVTRIDRKLYCTRATLTKYLANRATRGGVVRRHWMGRLDKLPVERPGMVSARDWAIFLEYVTDPKATIRKMGLRYNLSHESIRGIVNRVDDIINSQLSG